MDGSIEGDINELSYSPIVVTVYFVWVRAAMLLKLLCNTTYIHAIIHYSLIHYFSQPLVDN